MWVFSELLPGYKLRNPIQGEFFATSAIEGPAQALVRESVQNSLDARKGLPVRVLFNVVTEQLPSQPAIRELFGGAWEHYAATGNGLQEPKPGPTTPCPYLVVEDFNTCGLSGDPAQADPGPTDKNPFFLFFRAEGLSAKTGQELGRWGVGKFVFPRSSRASTHIGITVRESDHRRLMLGAVTLKGHHVAGHPRMFTPDGLYGVEGADRLVLPFEDPATIDHVSTLFNVQRRKEPGLSVIVPFIDPEEFSFERLLSAAIRDYFVPILDGRLEIIVRHDDRQATLARETLVSVLESNEALSRELLPMVRLAQGAALVQDAERITINMPDAGRAARWSSSLLGAGELDALRKKIGARELTAVRVPLTVRHKSRGNLPSYFDIYMQAERQCNERPVFVREGIIVSDVRGRRMREVRSLVVVEDRALAEMLGDSENPAHTQWQKDSSNFKGRYTYGPAVIDFVTDSVREILAIVDQASDEPDASLTVDFFSVEPPDDVQDAEESVTRRSRPQTGNSDPPTDVVIQPRPTRLSVQRSAGGFAIGPGSAPPETPFLIEVRCAYETRVGNSLKKWNPADFFFGGDDLRVTLLGSVRVAAMRNNHLILQVDGVDFRANVDGFDVSRDVYVRADIREATHASA
jgi:hypothetical protein